MTNNRISSNSRGVTLVEIAIVLVIIGLLLGGVLKGQELINNAKVRSMADRQNSLKVAWFSFLDRYQSIPGDYVNAVSNVPGAVANGDGNGVISLTTESVNVLQNLTGAGYLRCPQCTGAISNSKIAPSAANSLQNQYGGVMAIFHDGSYYAAFGGANGRQRLMVHTGQAIPSNIIAEVDRKIDDGLANTGDMVFNSWIAGGTAPKAAECMAINDNPIDDSEAEGGTAKASVAQAWRGAKAKPAVEQSCGASVVI